MKIIKVGKYTVMRHWFRWYFVYQINGGRADEDNYVVPINFPKDLE